MSSCKDCNYHEDSDGTCHRNPPLPTGWVVVPDGGWCGDLSPRLLPEPINTQ